MVDLSDDELLRYSRHLVMPEIGLAGQERLKRARVLCIGAGGLGSPAALYLAAAGIGRLGLVDFDTVDLSNIQRQVLYASADVGRDKLEAACERLAGLNPAIDVVPHCMRLDADNVLDLVADYDVVVDGSDNFPTRYLVNDAAVLAGKPDVHASVLRFEGQLSVFGAAGGPCYRCLFPEPPPAGMVPSCAEGGVIGMLPGILGSLQALEAVKLVLGVGEPLVGRLLLLDGLALKFRELTIERDPACPLCGDHPTIAAPTDVAAQCPDAVPREDDGETVALVAPRELAARVEASEIIDVREETEYAIANIPGATLIPLAELPQRLAELEKSRAYVLTCHRGGRARQAHALLCAAGFERLEVLDGGVDAWAEQVDPSMARY